LRFFIDNFTFKNLSAQNKIQMKRLLAFMFSVVVSCAAFAQQPLNDKEWKKFEKAEKELAIITEKFINDTLPFETRVNLIHEFIPKFVAILKEKNSFYYPFDDMENIALLVAPDSAFRIFTWQLKEPLGTHRYYGAMQMEGEDLKLIPFRDYSDTMEVHPQKILSPNNWYGGLYYNCIMREHNNKKYYTLFGFDKADFVSTRKFLEILTFNEKNEPVFGAPIFIFHDSTGVVKDTKVRFFREYSAKATAKLNYDHEMDIIIYDHLAPPHDNGKDAYFNYVPDGTYSGFKWDNGKWIWIEKIFHFSIDHPDNPPMPHPKYGDKKPVNPIFGK
jgi:hypothetical protein